MTRAEKAGESLGKSIVEMVNLMYQNNTALRFFDGLMLILKDEYEKRVDEMFGNKNVANNKSS